MIIQNKRILQILHLLDQNNGAITGNALAASVGVSNRTIRNDFKELTSYLQDKGAHIIAKTGQGYALIIDNKKKYRKFIDDLSLSKINIYNGITIVPFDYNDRISFIIARILLNSLHNKTVNKEALADELFISQSTLVKYLSDIKKSISRFNLTLTTDNKNGIKIDGAEVKIRYCISEYIFNKDELLNLADNKFVNDIFPKEEIEKVKQILLKVIFKYNIHLTDMAFKSLLIHLIITMRRAVKENTVEYSTSKKANLDKSAYFAPAIEILHIIKQQLHIDIINEVYYLTQHFIASQKFTESSKNDNKIPLLIQEILSTIKLNTDIDLSSDNELISGLSIHLIAAINRLKFNMNIKNDILKSIKDNYPLAFEMAVLAAKVLQKSESVQTNENEIGFLAIHFGASLERNKLVSEGNKTAIVVCGMGLSTALLVKSKLQRRFTNLQIIKIMSCYELTPEIINTVDFVFSTVPIKIDSPKIIHVDAIITKDDLVKIELQLNAINKNILNYELFFKKDLFFPDLDAKNAYDAINIITDKMLSKNYINHKIKDLIISREKMASTEIGNLIAIPHALDQKIKKAYVAVAILKEPILWHKETVQLIFLLCVPKNLNKLWSGFFEILFNEFIKPHNDAWWKNCSFQDITNKFKESE